MELLRAIQHFAWSYHSGDFLDGGQAHILDAARARAADRRRGRGRRARCCWRAAALARCRRRSGCAARACRSGASIARGVHSIVVVALGASLGREAAPQQAGAAVASALSDWAQLPEWQRRLLVACGAGAGMAAVYNVPLGGALFALEVLLGTLTLPLVLPALATSLIATARRLDRAADAPDLHDPDLPRARLADRVGADRRADRRPGGGRLHPPDRAAHTQCGRRGGCGWLRRSWCSRRSARSSIAYPQLLGNGKPVVQLALVGAAERGAAGGAARAQADRHGGVPGQRRAGRAVHADARLRRAAGRPARARRGRSCGRARRSAATRSSAARRCSAPRCRGRSRRSCCCSS